MNYQVSMPDPASHQFQMSLSVENLSRDTVVLKIPVWTPGYYMTLDYASGISELSVLQDGKKLPVAHPDPTTWKISSGGKSFQVNYQVKTERSFVACSYIDTTHAYLIPANNCFYVDGQLDIPVRLEVVKSSRWKDVATGLQELPSTSSGTAVFSAPDYDVLCDCPLLIGNLESLPSFEVKGVKHRFIGYQMGDFDKTLLMKNLSKTVSAAIDIFGEVPYDQYTFIAIGPGAGGIEHLNNTTISFSGARLKTEAQINDMLTYVSHEYFHNFNVKRIRPVELGPFDYSKPGRTTQLWVSEGLTMYYEYATCRRGGLMTDEQFIKAFEGHLQSVENNPARLTMSMLQSSYQTWDTGPFSQRGKSISYYEKGPLNGLIIDLAIRKSTQGARSLDDVMRYVYQRYYKTLKRGFTDAEFQEACEQAAGKPLIEEFEYISTTKEPDYNKYLNYIGLELLSSPGKDAVTKYTIRKIAAPTSEQTALYKGWAHL